jgi:hypothetical protein
MPNPEPFPKLPKTSPTTQTDITVVGIVEAGFEHGWILLRTTLLTTCQQDVPFQVVEVRTA